MGSQPPRQALKRRILARRVSTPSSRTPRVNDRSYVMSVSSSSVHAGDVSKNAVVTHLVHSRRRHEHRQLFQERPGEKTTAVSFLSGMTQ